MRWILRILIAAVALLLIAAVVVQAVLWSDWPRRRVIAQLEQETGLIFTASSLRAGWTGRSILRDVTVRLPLDDRPLAEAPEMSVRHTAVLPIIFGRDVRIESIRMTDPQVRAVQGQSGQWNLQRLIETVRARQADRPAAAPPSLPRIDIRDAGITLVTQSGRTAALTASHFLGEPVGSLEWSFDLEVASLLRSNGRVSVGGLWTHEVAFELTDAQDLVSVLADAQIEWPINAAGSWRGRVNNGDLSGEVALDQARVADSIVSGTATIEAVDGAIALMNPDLTLIPSMAVHAQLSSALAMAIVDSDAAAQGGAHPLGTVQLTGGRVVWESPMLRAEQLRLIGPGATAMVGAQFDTRSRRGSLEAQWSGGAESIELTHSGSVQASIEWPDVGRHSIAATVQTSGTLPAGRWSAEFETTARGPQWTQLEGRMSWPRLTWTDAKRRIDLSGLGADAQIAWPSMRVDNLHLPNANAKGQAAVDAMSREWSVAFAVQQWMPPITTDEVALEPLDLTIDAHGTFERIELTSAEIGTDDMRLTMRGTFAPNQPQPLIAESSFRARFPQEPDAEQPAASQPGALAANLAITGQVQPLDLTFSGQVTGSHVPVADGVIEQVLIPIEGEMNTRTMTFRSSNVALVGGAFEVAGTYRRDDGTVDMQVQGDHASLATIATLLGSPVEIDGTVAATARLHFPLLNPRAMQIDHAQWRAHDITHPAGAVRNAHGDLLMSGGVIRMDNLRLNADDETGTVTGNATFTPESQRLALHIAAERWPLRNIVGKESLAIDGTADIDVDLRNKTIFGSSSFAADVHIGEDYLGTIEALAAAHERTIYINSLYAETLDGWARGYGTLPLDAWTTSRAELEWSDIDLSLISIFIQELDSLSGTSSGQATLAPVEPEKADRALAPLRLDATIHTTDARSRNVSIGDATIVAFAGPRRVIADRVHVQVADGDLTFWGRLSWHEGEPFAHVTARARRLDLDQLAHWANPDIEPVPGRVSGSATAGGYLRARHRLFGQGSFELVESDLVNVGPFTLIHNALSLSIGDLQPTGEGRGSVRLEGDALELSRLEYFNRGTDVVASVRIIDITMLEESPITGIAVGAVRPLKGLDLPFFDDLERMMHAVQTGAASVRISGTVGEAETQLVPFAEISAAFQRVLTGSPR